MRFPRETPWYRAKPTTRARLITTAAELFRRQGYAQTGVNQIIQEADATSGSFYHFFPAKEDLLLAVVDHIAEVFDTEIFSSAADRSNDPIEEIFTILDLYRQQLNNGGFTFGSPMVSLSAEVSENHPQARVRLAEVFASWSDRIEELLAKCRAIVFRRASIAHPSPSLSSAPWRVPFSGPVSTAAWRPLTRLSPSSEPISIFSRTGWRRQRPGRRPRGRLRPHHNRPRIGEAGERQQRPRRRPSDHRRRDPATRQRGGRRSHGRQRGRPAPGR